MRKYTLIKIPQKFIFKKAYKKFHKGEVYTFVGIDEGIDVGIDGNKEDGNKEDGFNYESNTYSITFDGWFIAGMIKKGVILILA